MTSATAKKIEPKNRHKSREITDYTWKDILKDLKKNNIQLRFEQPELLQNALKDLYRFDLQLWTHKNGFGKTRVTCLAFKYAKKAVLTSLSHPHIKDKLLKELEEIGMKQDEDFVYYRPFEQVCETYKDYKEQAKKLKDYEELINISSKLRDSGFDPEFVHKEVIGCKVDCSYEKQKRMVSEIPRVLCSVEMMLNKFVEFQSDLIIIDEGDGILGKKFVEVKREAFDELQTKEVQMLNRNILGDGKLPFCKNKAKAIVKDDTKFDEKKTLENRIIEEIKQGKEPDKDIEDLAQLKAITEWMAQELIFEKIKMNKETGIVDVPLIYHILNSLINSKRKRNTRLIITFARMRNDELKKDMLRFSVDWLSFMTMSEPISEKEAVKIANRFANAREPLILDSEYPKDEWTLHVFRPKGYQLSNKALKRKTRWNPMNRYEEFANLFLQIHEQLSKITGRHKKEKGLLIAHKALIIKWQELRTLSVEELTKEFEDYNRRDEFLRAFTQRKYDNMVFKYFGNTSAGTELGDAKYVIVIGNWISGEITYALRDFYWTFKSYSENVPISEFTTIERNTNYRFSVIPEAPKELKEYVIGPVLRELMEYPMRARRKKPAYIITDLFSSEDPQIKEITGKILDEYNVKLDFLT